MRGCELPVIVCSDRKLIICGLCSTLRYIVQIAQQCVQEPAVSHCLTNLLGLHGNCLRACAEVSEWTLYTEVTLPHLVETIVNNSSDTLWSDPPTELLQFENQLAKLPIEPRRHRNRKQNTKDTQVDVSQAPENVTKGKCGSGDGLDNEMYEDLSSAGSEDDRSKVIMHKFDSLQVTESAEVIHGRHFAEGDNVQLTDLVLFVCIQLLFNSKDIAHWCSRLPRIVLWYQRMAMVPNIGNAVSSAGLFQYYSVANNFSKNKLCTLSSITMSSDVTSKLAENASCLLSTSRVPSVDLVHTKTATDNQACIQHTEKAKFHVSQRLVDACIAKATNMGLLLDPLPLGNGRCLQLPWQQYPSWVLPCGVPDKRAARKLHQLENIAAAVKELVSVRSNGSSSSQSSVIVDFCSGGGHVGILLAYLFPHYKVCCNFCQPLAH